MTRQRQYQLRNRAIGLCSHCSDKRVTATHCEWHRQLSNIRAREYQRRRHRYNQRYTKSESYQFQLNNNP